MEIFLFGQFMVRHAGETIAQLNHARLQELLAYLVLQRDRLVSRQRLAFLFWPDSSEAQARTNLRHLVHNLRRALPQSEVFLIGDAQLLGWNPSAPFTLDIADFQYFAAQKNSVTALQMAVDLYRGELLPGYYADWVLDERQRLEQAFEIALQDLIALHETQGNYVEAIRVARRLLQHNPLDEITYQILMRLHARQGDRAGVMRIYETCADVLERELGVLPGAETQAAYLRWLQPGQGAFLQTQISWLDRANRSVTNLPLQLTSLVGRVLERRQVSDLVASSRLVTLTGFGGVGKTRLAQAVATEVSGFQHGVWWVDLAPVAEATLIPRLIADAFKLQEQPEVTTLDILVDHLSDKHLLLLIDNCEHLLEGAAQVIAFLLQNCVGLHILATSRVSLRLPGEMVYPLAPLPIPNASQLPRLEPELNDSVRLFFERATAVLPTFSLNDQNIASVWQICRRLDGIPLAIELAAGRIKLLSPQQIANWLDEAFQLLAGGGPVTLPRHQTLQATMDWSYSLLSAVEQTHLRRLAIFSGTFTLPAAEAICLDLDRSAMAGQFKPEQVLQLTSSLVDHSLISVEQTGDEARYRLHEVCRQFARLKLERANEHILLADRHLAYYCDLAQQAETNYHRPAQLEWLRRLDEEVDNLRAALNWGLDHAELDKINRALSIVESLWLYWYIRGHFVEGLEWAERCLQVAQMQAVQGKPVDPIRYGRILYVAASFTFFMAEIDRANQYTIASLAACRKANDPVGLVISLHHSGLILRENGNSDLAGQDLLEGLELARSLRIDWLIAMLLNDLGNLARMENDLEQAKKFFSEDLIITRRSGDRWAQMYAVRNLARIALDEGELVLAGELTTEGLGYSQVIGDARGMGFGCELLGRLAMRHGRSLEAQKFFIEALEIFWKVRDRDSAMIVLGIMAQAAYALGDPCKAAQLLGVISAGRQKYKTAILPNDAAENENLRHQLCKELGELSFDSAWRRGERMELDKAIQDLLELG